MEKKTIWMLGWEAPTAAGGESEAWQPVAQALASQVKLQVLLPHNPPGVSLENMAITDLETVELPVRSLDTSESEFLPFAPSPFPTPAIPLYGTPVYTGKETGNPGQRQPGEAVRAGHANYPGTSKSPPATSPVSLHAQVIEYARKVIRFAYGKNFDAIYAFHWPSYLAGLELKLVTGKSLVLQVHTLSQNLHFPDRLGWMQEIEKQIFEKADAILVDHDQLAEALIKEYDFAGTKLSVTDGGRQTPEKLLQALRPAAAAGLAEQQAAPKQGTVREIQRWPFSGTSAESQTIEPPPSRM